MNIEFGKYIIFDWRYLPAQVCWQKYICLIDSIRDLHIDELDNDSLFNFSSLPWGGGNITVFRRAQDDYWVIENNLFRINRRIKTFGVDILESIINKYWHSDDAAKEEIDNLLLRLVNLKAFL